MADKEIPEYIEDAEKDEEGLTNEVYLTENEVIKVYTKYPVTSFLVSLTTVFSGPEYYTREKRIKSEKEAVKVMKGVDNVSAPEIKKSNKDTLIFEKVDGVSGHNYLDECSEDEAYELSESLREFFDYIHTVNFALRDARLSNFLIDTNTINSIDHEYADLNSNRLINYFDELTLVSSSRQTNNYNQFKEGFSPSKKAIFFSVFTSLGHAMLLERSLKRTKKIVKSVKSDL